MRNFRDVVLAAGLLFAVGCSVAGGTVGSPRELVVFAGASLAEPLEEIAASLVQRIGTRASFNYGGSNQLRAQIEQGARADVFASANQREMDNLVRAGLIAGEPREFARNRLVIAAPARGGRPVEGLQDLARPGVKVVVAGSTVPVGGYTLEMLEKASMDPQYGAGFKERVLRNVVSEETNVRQVVAKVQLGEADAGVVYVSDITRAGRGDIRMVEVPAQFNVEASFWIAVIRSAREPALATAFIEVVLSPEGRAVLAKHHFAAP